MVDFYLTRFACEMGKPIPRLSREAVDLMTHYGWPGNVRELRNICERLIVLSDTTEIGLREIQMLKIFRKKKALRQAQRRLQRNRSCRKPGLCMPI